MQDIQVQNSGVQGIQVNELKGLKNREQLLKKKE
jgi:hypothetical protein